MRLPLLAAALLLGGCSFLKSLPAPTTTEQRLASIPTEGAPVRGRTTIYWDEHQIPFVEAEYDEDAAFALGLAHAHLRLGLLEMARRVGQGRLSELIGKSGIEVDTAVRVLDFQRAIPEIEASLPDDTRRWIEGFVAGINHYVENAERMPHEFAVLGLEREPWTVADVLLIVRLGGSDVNWGVALALLPLRGNENWPQLLADLKESGSAAHTVIDGAEMDDLEAMIGDLRMAGSNAFAVSGERSESGAALLASDPHVGYVAPTIWLLAGVKCPSMHVVGAMPIGLPFFALGRNPDAAWGGTNLYAASSSFYDVSGLDPSEITVRREVIKVGSKERVLEIRESPYGPILSDLPRFASLDLPDVALRWTGHEPSDEVSAMLRANRSRTFAEFREAYRTYAIAGMNMIYADAAGHVGQIQAVSLPRRPADLDLQDIVNPPELLDPMWSSRVDATTLPAVEDPDFGYVASANNKPPRGDVAVGLVFSTDDRIDRLSALMRTRNKFRLEDLGAMQRDVYMASSVELRDALVDAVVAFGIDEELEGDAAEVHREMARWDGFYFEESRGAWAYELFRREFALEYYRPASRDSHSLITDIVGMEHMQLRDLATDRSERMRDALAEAYRQAARDWDDHATWGEAHRLTFTHPFAAIPAVGKRYRFGAYPMGGAVQTLMKSGHNPLGEEFAPSHGATARFLSDLSDVDENYAILVTGQDGWFNSDDFLGMTNMFLRGRYVPMPLSVEAVRARAVSTMELKP